MTHQTAVFKKRRRTRLEFNYCASLLISARAPEMFRPAQRPPKSAMLKNHTPTPAIEDLIHLHVVRDERKAAAENVQKSVARPRRPQQKASPIQGTDASTPRRMSTHLG